MSGRNKLTLESVNELYLFLQGYAPEGVSVSELPNLSPNEAFSVIWFLQGHLRVIPDHLEQCDKCNELYDSRGEGEYRVDEHDFVTGRRCDDCMYCD